MDEALTAAVAKLELGRNTRHVFLCVGGKCAATENQLASWDYLKTRLRELRAQGLIGGLLLLMHSHSFADPRAGLLVELSHLPIGVLAVLAGCARWVELRGPESVSRPARWLWPICLVLVGLVLVVYREA